MIKHSSAAEVAVSLLLPSGKLTLEIVDDGVGFDPQTVKKGLGLKGIEERARMTGSDIEIVSNRGAGATLRLIVNLP